MKTNVLDLEAKEILIEDAKIFGGDPEIVEITGVAIINFTPPPTRNNGN